MVIFDILQRDTRLYQPAIEGLLATGAAVAFLAACLQRELRRAWWRTLLPLALAALVLAIFAEHDFRETSDHYRRLVAAYQSGRYVVAQGTIERMDPPQPANRATSFEVQGRSFAYQPGFDSVAYDGQNGGPHQLRNGDQVRIYAVGGEIIHLELATRP